MLGAISRAIRRDWGLKIFSILVAAVLWFYVANTEDPIRSEAHERTVKVINAPEELEVVKTDPDKVKLKLRGRRSELAPKALAKVRVLADLSDARPGRNIVALNVTGVPERVAQEGVSPPTAQVWLDYGADEKKSVRVELLGDPADGYEVMPDPPARPTQIRISGPRGAVERVQELVARVDVSGWKTTRSPHVEVEALDSRKVAVPNIVLEPSKVTIDVPVFRVKTARVPVRPRVGKPPSGYEIADVRVSPDTVTLEGQPEDLRKVTEVTTEWVNIPDTRSTQAHKVRLDIPRRTWVVDGVRNVSVRVTIRPKAVEQPTAPAPPSEAEPRPPDDQETGTSNERTQTDGSAGHSGAVRDDGTVPPGGSRPADDEADRDATPDTGPADPD